MFFSFLILFLNKARAHGNLKNLDEILDEIMFMVNFGIWITLTKKSAPIALRSLPFFLHFCQQGEEKNTNSDNKFPDSQKHQKSHFPNLWDKFKIRLNNEW